MGNPVVNTQFHHLGVDHNELDLCGGSLVQDGNIDMYALYQGKQFSALNVP